MTQKGGKACGSKGMHSCSSCIAHKGCKGRPVDPPGTVQQQGESHMYKTIAESCTSVLDSAVRLYMVSVTVTVTVTVTATL